MRMLRQAPRHHAFAAAWAVAIALVVAACADPAPQGRAGAWAASTAPRSSDSRSPDAVVPATPRPTAPKPSAQPESLISQLTARGLYCTECSLFWDAVGMSVLAPAPSAPPAAPVAYHSWLTMRMTTARGASISLADFAGRPVIVEMMATWCGTCVDQQDALREARPNLPPDTVIISVSVDPRDDQESLARYAAARGYDWEFATGPVVLLRALDAELGDAALNPAGAPILVIDRAGAVALAPAGLKDVPAIRTLAGS